MQPNSKEKYGWQRVYLDRNGGARWVSGWVVGVGGVVWAMLPDARGGGGVMHEGGGEGICSALREANHTAL
jgi:hypothetical protein